MPLIIAAVSLSVSVYLLHAQLASALVTRGDDLAYMGDVGAARVMYGRALAFDPGDATAADRFVFSSILSHRQVELGEGASVATRFLDRDPSNATVRMDRALCYERLHDDWRAIADFRIVGRRTKDGRALTFAALLLARHHDFEGARIALHDAIRLDPAFRLARTMLLHVKSRSSGQHP
jgi:tetratricopeptide (TPR) repeat protein